MSAKFDPKRMIRDMLKNVAKVTKKTQPIDKKIGRHTLQVVPQTYELLQHELAIALFNKKLAAVEAYLQAEAEFKALLEEGLSSINQLNGGRLTLSDPFKFSSIDGLITVSSSKNATPTITPHLVEARKQFVEFIKKYNFEKDRKVRPLIRIAEKSFKAIDRDISPRPQDLKDLANALAEYDFKKMPEAHQISALLLQGWEVKEDKREIRVTVREDATSNAKVVSIRNYQPQPQEC